jgi:hypothetical protein
MKNSLSTKRCELVKYFQDMWIQILCEKKSLQSRAVLLNLLMVLKDMKKKSCWNEMAIYTYMHPYTGQYSALIT